MGALDDLIAQDEEEQRKRSGAGGMTDLDRLIAQDIESQSFSQDPETVETPSFVGYDPASKPAPTDDLRSDARGILEGSPEADAAFAAARARAGGADPMGPINRMAEAGVGMALPGAGKGASLGRRMAVEGAQSMGMDAAHQADEAIRSPSDEPFDMRKAAQEVLMSGGFGALGGAAGDYLRRGANAVRGWAGTAADKAKNLVAGQGAREAKAIAAAHGVDAIDDAGKLLEKYSPSGLTGKSSGSHLKVVSPEREAVGDDLRQMAFQINEKLAPNDLPRAREALQDGLADEADRVAYALPEDEVQYGTAIKSLQDRLARKPGFESFPELIGEKSGLQGFGHSGAGGTVPEAAQKQAAAYGGGVLKDEVSRIVDQMPPELRDRYIAQNQNFAELSGLEENLRNKAAAEAQGGDMGGILGNSVISGIVGAGAGAAIDDSPIEGAAKGGLTGFAAGLGLQGGATRTAIRQGAGSRLTDAGANMLRGIERGAGAVSEGAAETSRAAIAALGGEKWGDRQEKPGEQVAVAHGLVGKLLKEAPEELDGFAPMLQEFADDPLRLSAAITNLAKKEPMFRRKLRELEERRKAAPVSRPQSGITYSLGEQ